MEGSLGLRLVLFVMDPNTGDVVQTITPPADTNLPVAWDIYRGDNFSKRRLRVVQVAGDWPDYIPAEDRRIRIQFFDYGMSVSAS